MSDNTLTCTCGYTQTWTQDGYSRMKEHLVEHMDHDVPEELEVLRAALGVER